jgi:small basic protein
VPLPLSIAAKAKLAQPGPPAPPFTIKETTGGLRTVVLRGRSLPYRGVVYEGEQRVEAKYFPGNPVATAQVLGHMFGPTTIRGIWKDAFLSDATSRAELRNFPPVAATARPGSGFSGGPSFASAGSIPGAMGFAETARVLRDALEMIKRSGQMLRVEWGSLVRFGFLKRTAWTHGDPTGGESDIAWEMEFTWIGDTASVPKPKVPARLDPSSLAAKLLQALQTVLNALNAGLAQVYANQLFVQQRFTKLLSLVTGLLTALDNIIGLAFVPVELLGVLQQQLNAVKLAAKGLADTVRSIPAAYQKSKEGGTVLDANAAAGVQAAIIANTLRLGELAGQALSQLDDQLTPDILAFVTATGQETLRDLAFRYYSDASQWPAIYTYNGLTTSQLARGQRVVIPRLN